MISRKFIAERRAKNLLKKSIKDDELRSKVTPDFVIGCKRVLLSNTIYPTYQRDNVFLYSREEATIQAITPSGILTKSGCELELDLIVYATGYDVLNGMVPFAVYGKDGIKLQHCWDPLPHAYLGATVPNFPNLFITHGPNIQTGHTSTLVMIEAQMHYIMTSISEVLKNDAKYIEVKQEAEEEYNRMIQRAMKRMVWKTGGCHSWYQNKDGDVMALYPGFSFTFVRMAKNFRPNHHYIR
jgi:cation diffusion facilitator CzcD-associated flavoprotein CzcO